MQTQIIKVNLVPNADIPERIYLSQYDKGSRTLKFELYDGAVLYAIPDGISIAIQGTKPDRKGFQYACSYSGSVVSCTVQDQMTAVAGEVPCELVISKDGSILATANFILAVERSALADDTIISETEMPLIEQAAAAFTNAEANARSAQFSAEKADNSAASAQFSAEKADNSAASAKSWAVGPSAEETSGTDTNNAKYWAEQVKDIVSGLSAEVVKHNERLDALEHMITQNDFFAPLIDDDNYPILDDDGHVILRDWKYIYTYA